MAIEGPFADTSAVVVAYRAGPRLLVALETLLAAGAGEVVVVDNGSTPAEEDALDEFAAAQLNVRVLRGHGNVGFGAGCNLGARTARGAILAFANPDLEADRRAIAALREALAEAPPPAVVGARLFGLDGREQRGARRDLYTPWNVLVAYAGLARLERFAPAFRDPHRERDPPPDRPIPVGAVSGAFFAMRREDFFALEGFDEGYFLHVEDVDLCRRAREAGGVVLFAPAAMAVHVGGGSAAGRPAVEAAKAQSFARYFGKFAQGPVDRAAAAAGPLIAQALRLRQALARRR